MKKGFYILIILILITFSSNVFACGELTDVTTSVGTIRKVKSVYYVITVPEGTKKVNIGAKSDSPFVEGEGPREVFTSSQVRIRVDGEACGEGITSYFFDFEVEKKVVPLPDPKPVDPPVKTSPSLKDLKIENIALNFDKDVYSYSVEVPEEVTSIDIIPEVEDTKDTFVITGNHQELTFGLNQIQIVLTGSNGEKTTYTINVARKKNLSDNNYLSYMKIENYIINFDTSIFSYNLKIDKEKKLNIIVTTSNEFATYEIIGNENLENNSLITIKVTAENGSVREYFINILKEEKNTNMYLIYSGIGLAIVLIIILVVFIINKNKRKKQAQQISEVPISNSLFINDMPKDENMDAVPFSIENNTPNVIETQVVEEPIQTQNVGLEYISPSYLENVHVDENNSNTEIFKL